MRQNVLRLAAHQQALDPKFLSYPVAAMSDCDKFVGISAG